MSKNLEGGTLEGKKKLKKNRTVPKKIERGDPSVSSAFANALAKARTRTRDRSVHRKPSKVCTKKWYIHDEVCGLKKTSHCNSRALFTRKAPTKNEVRFFSFFKLTGET